MEGIILCEKCDTLNLFNPALFVAPLWCKGCGKEILKEYPEDKKGGSK